VTLLQTICCGGQWCGRSSDVKFARDGTREAQVQGKWCGMNKWCTLREESAWMSDWQKSSGGKEVWSDMGAGKMVKCAILTLLDRNPKVQRLEYQSPSIDTIWACYVTITCLPMLHINVIVSYYSRSSVWTFKILYAFLVSHILATRSAHNNLLEFPILTILDDLHKSRHEIS
jgi:hypothetical protein